MGPNDLFSENESKHPSQWVSVLIACYNTDPEYISECLGSIKNQKCLFGIELVWINDGSNPEHSNFQENMLDVFISKTKNTKKIYKKMETNMGLSYCLHEGVLMCSYDLIIRMDADDIMDENRIQKQVDFMNLNTKCVLCGTNIHCFLEKENKQKIFVDESNHDEMIIWDEYIIKKSHWILNHPSLCFRKYAVISVGNYNKDLRMPFEDLDLELRILKKYKFVCNLPEKLLLYRIHDDQITWKNREYSTQNKLVKNKMIENIISSNNNRYFYENNNIPYFAQWYKYLR